MRKKFTMLLAALLACAGVMKADVTDLPVLTTSTDDIKWYAIKNTRSGKYASYAGDGVQMTQEEAISVNSLFYFTAVDGEVADGFTAVKIHALMTENLLSNYNSWTAEGVTWYLHEDTYSKVENVVTPAGLHFVKEANLEGWNALNDAGQTKITDYYSQDEGSIFVVESVDASQLPNLVDAYKEAAKTELETLAQGTDIYPAATTAIEEVEDVALVNTTPSEVIAAAEAVDAIVATYKTNAYKALAGKYFTLYTPGRSRYAKMTVSGTGNAGTASTPDFIWQFVENNGSVNIYNPYIGKYLVMNGTNAMNVTANQAEAGAFDITVASSPSDENAKIGFKSNGWYIHLNGSLLGWYAGGASEWTVAEVADFTTMVEAYKLSSITALDSWSTLSVVFDAGLINTAKENINAIETTDWATFAAIDAELKNVTDAVAAKMFTFQNSNTTEPNRSNVYLAADMSDNKGRGNKVYDYNAVWSLKSAGGASFYLYNELNEVYLGTPSSAGTLTSAPAAAYTFEVVDKNTNLVELKSGGQTLHVHNWEDCTLTNYDGDESASRWYVKIADITTDITTLLETIGENDYAEEPALGQYPKAAYDALVEAKTTAKTIQEVEAAIAAFKLSLNSPVYFITSAHDGYAAGSAIYYDGAWKWKAANKFDKQMWMTIPGYTQENVPVVDTYDADGTSYEICDFLTGTVMRGKSVQIVKISGWEGAYNLQYGTTQYDAAQHAAGSGSLVNWNPATSSDCQASAWQVEYIGNSYDLAQLPFTDEFLTAAAELRAVTVPAFDFKDGVNNYDETTKPALDAAVKNRAIVLSDLESTTEDLVSAKQQLVDAIAGVQINMPENGKFYRVRCAGNGMKYLQSTLDESNANDVRLQVLSSATSVNATFCYIDGALLSYTTGLYINAYRFNGVGTKSEVAFSKASNGKVGTYNILVDGRYIFGASDNNKIDSGTTPDARDGYTWWLEEVTTLPVTVSAAGYATLYAPVALNILEESVTVYTAAVKGEYLTLKPIEEGGAIPANTGVLIEAAEGTYNFEITGDDFVPIDDNAFTGALAKSTKNAEKKVYTLQKPTNNEVGFYLFKGQNSEGATTYINGFRAWVELDPETSVQALRITRGGAEDTTGIEQLVDNNAELVIYDLLGRRVEKMEKGIYIVNGRKVVIK